ncbi:MAG: ATP-dependent Clp protease ATP-binding subunit [Candidatus Harrisonbacteria bacterium]|nr:ATP-dependent Clp protease ATP-binding subunit [Candidatus Harrisonbacteria bacterium]
MNALKQEIYFKEPRLKMTIAGRFVVRLVSFSVYGVFIVGSIISVLSDLSLLRAAGILIIIFLIDRFFHWGRAERSLANLPKGAINAAYYLPPSSFGVVEWAFDRAMLDGEKFFLYAARRLAGRKDIREGLLRMDAKPEELIDQIDNALKGGESQKASRADILKQAEDLIKTAFLKSYKFGSNQIEPKDLFSALSVVGGEKISRIFDLLEIDDEDLEHALIFSRYRSLFWKLKKMPASLVGLVGRPYKLRHRVMNRSWTARPTPFLDRFAEDITDLARLEIVGFLIGHANEYDRLVDVLSRPGRPNALLVGEPGSGKSTLVAHLAFEIVKDRVPQPLFDKRLVKLEISSLIAGASEAEIQERVKKVIDEIVSAGNIVLYIPDIHNLLKTSGPQRLSAADAFIPAIKGGAFSVIGSTYPREFKQQIETNSDFVSAFEVIRVEEISEAEAIRFLVYSSLLLEKEYKTIISFAAIKQAVTLAKKYFHQKLLPASAEDLLKETLADVRGKGDKVLNAEDLIAVAEKKINVPIHRAGKDEAEKLLNLEDEIHRRLIDQEEAVKAVARSLREYRSGLGRKGGPIASFLFVGPTGVGKTELSKILARIQFGSSEAMVRFDMSEYQDKSTVNRLLDNVTDAIKEKPYSLILLDEFEKAHPDILNLFLQVFDDGRMTDSLGKTVDFTNTIIISTSNAHSEFVKSEIESGKEMRTISEDLKKKLTTYFKPELLNRFSGIIVFRSLLPEHIAKIAKIQLSDLAANLREGQGVDLEFDEKVVKEISILGYDPVFGARPLRGVISDKLRSVLAEKVLKGEVVRGSNLVVSLKGGKFVFNKK